MRQATTAPRSGRVLAAGAVTASALVTLVCSPAGHPAASAEVCPDVEVVFARGTTEPPGIGGFGQQFVDALRSDIGERSLDVYPVNYPASTDFPTAADGVVDASNHIRKTAASCPNTKMVLGGYSQGAAVMGYVTAAAVPAGFVPPSGLSGPMPAEVADHVAAVALLGKPSSTFLQAVGAPPLVIGPRYADKTIDLCAPADPICTPGGGNNHIQHMMYGMNGMMTQAADFAAQRVNG